MRKPSGALTALTLAAGYASFAATFRGPKDQFWQRMTRTGLLLGGTALATDADLRAVRPKPKDLAIGAAIAAGLYAVFFIGDKAARMIMPNGAEDIGQVYELRSLRPKGEIAARLAGVIGPAEELFWRGMLQSALTRRLGPVKGAAAATAAYGGAHLVTANPTLIGAATVAGAGWSGLAALGTPMPALVLSHIIWDIWIFLVQPTQPVP
ncbi:MAG: CPBP family intramembrane metalloprotease [Actinobacteria bacterium]|nr:CPBP family intramembrane metalloprotease [Actinomycetota bacterium]MCA1719736.1 CPBP family intramembrane metalloprotease [Actinomycetota bacterium]